MQNTPGFAIQIVRDTDLGIATLIVEDQEGNYEPVNYASSLGEGFEMAKEDLRNRQGKLEADKDPGLYRVPDYAALIGMAATNHNNLGLRLRSRLQ